MNLKTTCFAALAILCLLTTSLFAQTETGQITGTVMDASGAVIAAAKVTVRNVETGATRVVTTTGAGVYAVPNLQPGTYEISVEVAGFGRTKGQVEVAVGVKTSKDFTLQVGTTETVVEVAA